MQLWSGDTQDQFRKQGMRAVAGELHELAIRSTAADFVIGVSQYVVALLELLLLMKREAAGPGSVELTFPLRACKREDSSHYLQRGALPTTQCSDRRDKACGQGVLTTDEVLSWVGAVNSRTSDIT